MRKQIVRPVIALAALAVTTASCGDVVRTGRSPVYLVIDSLQAAQGNNPAQMSGVLTSDVITLVTSPAPCTPTTPCPTIFNDYGQAVLRITDKSIPVGGISAPSSHNEVTINRYHVSFRRADGRNTPGVDVPYAFDGAVTGTVGASTALTLPFEIVKHVAKAESPLVQLIDSRTVINTIADVTFYGRDQVGNDISVTGSITIEFGNFGDKS